MLSKIIKNFVAKMVAGRADDGIMITLKDPKKVEFQGRMLEDLLMRNGIDPNAIKSEQQLKNILNQIEAFEKKNLADNISSGIRNTKSAKVFDLEGQEIKNTKNIMGGKEIKFDDDLPPPGSRGGSDDIAAPVQSQEETMKNMVEAEIKAKLEKQNKSAVENILKRKNREDVYGLEDYDTTNMSEIKKEIIRTETKLGNLNPDSPGFREKAKVLSDRIIALKNKMREDKADGGMLVKPGSNDTRQGYRGDAAYRSASEQSKSIGQGNVGSKASFGGGKGVDRSGRDEGAGGAVDRSTFQQTVNQRKTPIKQKSGIEKLFDAGQEFNYLKNLAIGNFPGIGKQLLLNYGKKKLFDDQAMLNTEEDQNMMLAELSQTQLDFLNSPKIQRDLKEFDREPKAVFDMLPDYEEGGFFKKNQEPTTPQEFNEYLDSIGVQRMKVADGGRIGLKFGTGKKFLQKVFGAEKFAEMKTRDPEMYVGLLEVVDMYRKRDKEGLKMYLQKFLPHMDDTQIEDFIRGSDGTEGLIGELIRLGSGRDYAGKIEMMKRSEEMKKLRDLEVTDDMIRKPNADGGIMRLGFKEGSGMSRRTFLKFLAGAASIPIVGKILKPFKIGKTVTKVPIIKTDNVPGKPEWFDQLVNKVIIEGDEVTKRFATKDREIVHMKKLDEDTNVTVYQDLDEGAVRVEYNSADNMYEDPVQLQYKKPNPDEGNPRPGAEFDVAESGPVGRADGPDDYSIDIDEVGGTSISDLTSDVSKLKEYATGQKPTLKEFVQSKKRKDKARRITEGGEAEMDAVIERQGEFIENDLVDIDPPDYASGGIARMLGE